MSIKDQVCHWCKKQGHLPRVCQSKSKTFPPTQRTQSKRPTLKPTRQVGEESEDNSEDSMRPIYTLEQGQDTPPAASFHPWSWLPGVIEQRTGPASFKVRLQGGRIRHCHQDQVRNHSVEVPQESHTKLDTTTPTTVSSELPLIAFLSGMKVVATPTN